ncbi:EAL domain-containing protein [Psychrobium sp. MM17-31]|uniref:EAL domain-containing protein n=1 Tax=Psychrobium sp. MM17-31 TaxID=2917758 RepID=UPI001EF3E063|nr:EAL domain-containing protein [Psychrobium sp. MM17-31]MCG7532486.1 EAL domain-containing protein [Psychrobium sp. MM17-31]
MDFKKISALIITLVILSCSFYSIGADIVISKAQPKVNILQPLATLKTNSQLDPNQLLYSKEFTPELFAESNQASRAIYWHRLSIRSEIASENNTIALLFQSHVIEQLDVYLYRDGVLDRTAQLGLKNRPALTSTYHGVLFEFELVPNERATLLIRKESKGPKIMPITVMSHQPLADYKINILMFYGVIIGIFIALSGYNAIIYALHRSATYKWYMLYQTAVFLEFSALFGFGYFIFPEASIRWLAQHISMININLIWFALLFSCYFLEMKTYSKKLYKFISRTHWLLPAISLLGFVLPEYTMMAISTPLLLAVAITCIYVGYKALIKGYSPASIYLLSWLSIVIGGLVGISTYAGFLPQNVITMHAFLIGSLLELYILSIALAKRLEFNELQQKRKSFIDPIYKLPNSNFYYQEFKTQLAKKSGQDASLKMVLIKLEGVDEQTTLLGSVVVTKYIANCLNEFNKALTQQPWSCDISLIRNESYSVIFMGTKQVLVLVRGEQSSETQVNNVINCWHSATAQVTNHINIQIRASILDVSDMKDDPVELYRRASTAVIEAKRQSSDWALFDINLDLQAKERVNLLNKLELAIERQALEIYIQPKVDLFTQRVIGGETLMRWHDKEDGFISPGVFIPIAEHSGLIFEITKIALRQAFVWMNQHKPDISLSINLSVFDLQHDQFIPFIQQLCESHPINRANIMLEITESQDLDNSQELFAVIRKLKEMGFKISIDDFGTGYSSMIYLSQIDPDEIKIDMAFVSGIDHNPINQSVVETLLKLAKTLQSETIIEGIENDGELEVIRTLGGKYGQGYYWSPAIKTDEFYRQYLQSVESVD